MNQAIVDRAIEALAKVGATRSPDRPADKPMKPEDTKPKPPQEEVAPCDSLLCAGCYGVAPGVRIHPPKSGPEWREWLLKWEPKGKLQ